MVKDDTYVDRHLINMYALLDAKFRDKNIESSVKNADDNGWSDDWAIPLR